MDSKEYERILDAIPVAGIYVIREDNHVILYFNKRIQEIAPNVCKGAVCHELWTNCCSRCPLLTIGDRQESRVINYNSPFGSVVEITATRILWEEHIPAFVITLTPCTDTVSKHVYRKIFRVDLLQDRFSAVVMDLTQERSWVCGEALSCQLEQFVESGAIHPDDVERFLSFANPENLRRTLAQGSRMPSLIYRRRQQDEYRWNLLEIIPDYDFTEKTQPVLFCIRDVHDELREGLGHAEASIRGQEAMYSLGEQNFSIYSIDLDAGTVNPIRLNGQTQDLFSSKQLMWDAVMRAQVKKRLHSTYQEEFEEQFSLEGLRQAKERGEQKTELLCQWQSNEAYRYVSVTAFFSQGLGAKRYAVLALQDVDDRMRQELAHTQRDMQMAAILKSQYSMLITVYLDSGKCERVFLDESARPRNTDVGDYAQYTQEQLAGFVHPDDRGQFFQTLSLSHLRETAQTVEDYLEEVCQYRLDSTMVQWLEQHVVYIRQGEDVLVSILGRDITKEKQQEETRLRAAQERADIIRSLTSMFFSTYYIDLEHDTFQVVNQLSRVGAVLGAEVDCTAAFGVYAQNFVHPDDRAEYLEVMSISNWSKTLRWWNPFVALEYRKLPGNPSDKQASDDWIRATAVLAQANPDGSPKTVVYAAQDVTASKQKEELERRALKSAYLVANQASASKSEFMSRMSHDIRTPLNGIIGMTTIAASHLDDQGYVQNCLNKIATSGRQLLSLVNEVLDMSQIESGKMSLAEKAFNLPALVRELSDIIFPDAHKKGLTLNIHPLQVEHEVVIGDSVRLQQVFVNIMSNCVKYTPAGGLIELSVTEAESKEYGYGQYDFIFRDNGIGMDEAFVKRIFEPFSRAEDSRVSKIEGAGLGMTIAQNIVRMMGGSISVKSKPGAGSQFTVALLLKQENNEERSAPEAEPQSSPESNSSEDISFQGHCILLAEDNEINREIAVEIIGSTGAEIECVENGQEALQRFIERGEGYYDLIFMDIQMPVMDGHTAARAIRKLPRADAVSIPIVAMSANAFVEDTIASREAGMNEHITKPLDIPRLMACMNHWLNQQ